MRKRWSTVIRNGPSKRVRIDLIAGTIQRPPPSSLQTLYPREVTVPSMLPDAFAIQNCVCNFHSPAHAAASRGGVAAHGAVDNHHIETAAHDSATVSASRVAADRAVNDGQTRLATSDTTPAEEAELPLIVLFITVRFPGIFPRLDTCTPRRRAYGVATDCGVDNRYAARIVVDAGARVIVDNALGDC